MAKLNVRGKILDPRYNYETRLELLNLDKECIKDITSANGFFVEEPQNIKKDLKSPDSIFSIRFGTVNGEADVFMNRYRCKCGALRGRINHNLECSICHTPVKYIDDNFEYFGWICLKDKYHIIHPNLFKSIQALIGTARLETIIKGEEEKDENGFTAVERVVDKGGKFSNEPFYQIGMIKFYEQFDEILNYYIKKYPNKKDHYDHIMANRDKVFIHSIPVYTVHLRPVRVEGENLVFEKTNSPYNLMAKLAQVINRDNAKSFTKTKIKKILLYELQMEYMNLYEEIEAILANKKGVIRNLLGGRYNFTSRSVIVSEPTLRIDQIRLSYHVLVKVLQQTIINIIKKTYNVNLSVAYDIWYKARLEVNPRVVDIINNLIKAHPEGIPFIINRNPSINYGSILQMYCVGISFDYTMAIPLQILPLLNADFDGDCLNILYLINKEYIRRCEETFNPRNAMYISKNNGLFNNDVNHFKDTIISTNTFIHLARNSYSEDELNAIKQLMS